MNNELEQEYLTLDRLQFRYENALLDDMELDYLVDIAHDIQDTKKNIENFLKRSK